MWQHTFKKHTSTQESNFPWDSENIFFSIAGYLTPVEMSMVYVSVLSLFAFWIQSAQSSAGNTKHHLFHPKQKQTRHQ